MQESFVGESEAGVEFAGRGDHTKAVRNCLRGLAKANKRLPAAHVLAFTEIILGDSNVVEKDSRGVQVAVKSVNVAVSGQARVSKAAAKCPVPSSHTALGLG